MLSSKLDEGLPAFLLSSLSFVALAAVAYLTILTLYRLFFHPLSKYPGPFAAKITDWYSVYHAWKGDRHLEFWRCHEKYGPIFRYGPNSVSINSNTALKSIYGHKSNVKKSQFYSVFPATKHAVSTHTTIDKAAHARKRRVLSNAFSDSAIKSMEKYILANIRTFCLRVGLKSNSVTEEAAGSGQWTVPRNMADWCNYLTFDVMGDLCFGKAFEMMEHDTNRKVIDLIGNAAHMHLILGTNPMIKTLGLNKVLFRKIYERRMQYMAYSKSQAVERTKMGSDTDRRDFFYYLLNATDPETGNGFTTQELWGESNLLIIAGSDTTSTALGSALFYLVHNAGALEKLSREILSTFSDIEEIHSNPKLNGCTYLRAVVDEAMRMSPPVGGILPREVQAGGLDVDGIHLPEGVVVGTPIYTIHHNPAYYPEPFSYIPERWIVDSSPAATKESVELAHTAFCPFSIGSRGCIGKGIAYLEILTTLARLVYLYEMRLAEGIRVGEGSPDLEWGRHREGDYQLRDSFTSMKDGPYVQFRERVA